MCMYVSSHDRTRGNISYFPIIGQGGYTQVRNLATATDGNQRINDDETSIMQYIIREWAGVGSVSVHPMGFRDSLV